MSSTNFISNLSGLGSTVPVGYLSDTTNPGDVNISFNALDGLIYFFAQKENPPYTGTLQALTGTTAATNAQTALNAFLGKYNSSNPLPSTWTAFVAAAAAYTSTSPVIGVISNPNDAASGTLPNSASPLDGFLSEYRYITQTFNSSDLVVQSDGTYSVDPGAAVGGDLAILASASGSGTPPTGIPVTAADLSQQFQAAFASFISEYTYPTGTPTATSNLDSFFNQFHSFMTVTTSLNSSSIGNVPLNNVVTYRQIMNAFFPNISDANFTTFLQKFYSTEIASKGFFIPSQSFSAFTQAVQNDYFTSIYGNANPQKVSVDTGYAVRLLVLNKIFALLAQLIGTLQNVAVAQSSGLRFLTVWQKAYTDLMNQVPTFVSGDGSSVGALTGDDGTNKRNELNTKANALLENLRGSRSLVSDNAKSLQSNFNQTNDSVNQQSNMATSIIQQFSTILGSIFR